MGYISMYCHRLTGKPINSGSTTNNRFFINSVYNNSYVAKGPMSYTNVLANGLRCGHGNDIFRSGIPYNSHEQQ